MPQEFRLWSGQRNQGKALSSQPARLFILISFLSVASFEEERKLKGRGKTKALGVESKTCALGSRPHYLFIMWIKKGLLMSQGTSFLNCRLGLITNIPVVQGSCENGLRCHIWTCWSQSLAPRGDLIGSMPGPAPGLHVGHSCGCGFCPHGWKTGWPSGEKWSWACSQPQWPHSVRPVSGGLPLMVQEKPDTAIWLPIPSVLFMCATLSLFTSILWNYVSSFRRWWYYLIVGFLGDLRLGFV